jgi:hypothetical protein
LETQEGNLHPSGSVEVPWRGEFTQKMEK